jgi:nucleoside-diphosphate-sugar epimerase
MNQPIPQRRAFVTGASGFIGRVLCRRLQKEGWEVTAMLRRPQEGPWDRQAIGTLGEAKGELPEWAAAMAGAEVVFHLGGKAHALLELHEDEAEYGRVNVAGTSEVMAAARSAGVARVVYFSSVKVYSDSQIRRLNVGEGRPVDEREEPAPDSPYGQSKLEAERKTLESDVETVVLRLCMVYGPSLKGNLAKMIEAVVKGRFPPLGEVGNRRSMVHVDDVVDVALLGAERVEAVGKAFLVTGAEPVSTRQLYQWICQAVGRIPPRWSVPLVVLKGLGVAGDLIGRVRGRRFVFDSDALEKLVGNAWFSSEKAQVELGYRPGRGLQETIPAMVEETEGSR